ncbi:CapA family protein [Saccharicrinis sp. FJH54]|uniref:CapA family protein n=1 Tax=Saccharicrinis sp. FJH54 TaxID=3344665 RepID=UPI0035D40210
MHSTRLLIAGDIYLGRKLEKIGIEEPDLLFGSKITQLFSNESFNIINLESSLNNLEDQYKIIKTGPHLKANPLTTHALKSINIDLVTLANNHIYDYGAEGLKHTFNALNDNNIKYTGAGLNLKEAQNIFYKKVNNLTIAIINIAENEWSNATLNSGGANPLDIIDNTKQIIHAKANADFVILIIHGGHENYKYPSPRMINLYRYFAELGSDAIICHHTHITSGYEIYKNVPIFYGIGNFLFHSSSKLPGWHNGMVVELILNKTQRIDFNLYPYEQCKDALHVELLNQTQKNEFLAEVDEINLAIQNEELLNQKFNSFVKSNEELILSMFSTSNIINNRYFEALVRRLNIQKYFLRKNQLKSILNYMRCESHYDITNKIIISYLKSEINSSKT